MCSQSVVLSMLYPLTAYQIPKEEETRKGLKKAGILRRKAN